MNINMTDLKNIIEIINGIIQILKTMIPLIVKFIEKEIKKEIYYVKISNLFSNYHPAYVIFS